MKNLKLFFFAFMTLSILTLSCSAKTSKEEKSADASKNDKVEVYYFHGTRRCATCQAVEAVTVDALKEYYGDKIALQSLNFEEDKNKALVEKFQVSGQTLLVVKGGKKEDLTNDAFMNARSNPDKLKAKIKSVIDPLMN